MSMGDQISMFDDTQKVTYAICNRYARWSQLFCKGINNDAFTFRNRLLQYSQSLPLYYAEAGAAATDRKKQEARNKVLASAFKISEMLHALANGHKARKTLIDDGLTMVDAIIVRLTIEQTPAFFTSPPATSRKNSRVVT